MVENDCERQESSAMGKINIIEQYIQCSIIVKNKNQHIVKYTGDRVSLDR